MQASDKSLVRPSDKEFNEYFEGALSSVHTEGSDMDPADTVVNVPISPQELTEQIARIKPDKSCGPDDIHLGVFLSCSRQTGFLALQHYLTVFLVLVPIQTCGRKLNSLLYLNEVIEKILAIIAVLV